MLHLWRAGSGHRMQNQISVTVYADLRVKQKQGRGKCCLRKFVWIPYKEGVALKFQPWSHTPTSEKPACIGQVKAL